MRKQLIKEILDIIDEYSHRLPEDKQWLLFTNDGYVVYDFESEKLVKKFDIKDHCENLFRHCWCACETPEIAEELTLTYFPKEKSLRWLNRSNSCDRFISVPFDEKIFEVSVQDIRERLMCTHMSESHFNEIKILHSALTELYGNYNGHLFE